VETKTVGPTGNYASLGAAITDITANGLASSLVLELQSAYVSTVETFPITFGNLDANAGKTITIRPEHRGDEIFRSQARTRQTTIDLNAGHNIIFDGRPGGTGTSKATNHCKHQHERSLPSASSTMPTVT
jgi:hypothetical protein